MYILISCFTYYFPYHTFFDGKFCSFLNLDWLSWCSFKNNPECNMLILLSANRKWSIPIAYSLWAIVFTSVNNRCYITTCDGGLSGLQTDEKLYLLGLPWPWLDWLHFGNDSGKTWPTVGHFKIKLSQFLFHLSIIGWSAYNMANRRLFICWQISYLGKYYWEF